MKINVAILGLGTVGQGILQLLEKEKEEILKATGCEVVVKKCLEKFTTKKLDVVLDQGVLTNRWKDILEDESIQIVIEAIGGIEPARTYVTQALRSGKNVITANNDLIASAGQDLMKIASENRKDLYFEAAVCSGIPVIGPIRQSISAGNIEEMVGIVNSTTNYILTHLEKEHRNFEDILMETVEKGYAEADPSADIEGYDAARKMAILSTLAFHTQVNVADVYTEGISKIGNKDIAAADKLGYKIKLLGIARRNDKELEVRVHPTLISKDHPLAAVVDNNNGVLIKGKEMGDSMFYGKGSGKLPSASAVLGDVACVARNITSGSLGRLNIVEKRELGIRSIQEVETSFFLRLLLDDHPGVLARITDILSKYEVSLARVLQKPLKGTAELILMTHKVKNGNMEKAIQEISLLDSTKEVLTVLRVEE